MAIIKKFQDFSLYEKKKVEDKKEDKETNVSDEEKYLSPKQRKLPEALKKGLIAKYKKHPKKEDADEKKEEPKKYDVSKSDEENYLTAKQRKLPEGLKKGIIARMKKKKVNESHGESLYDIIENYFYTTSADLHDDEDYSVVGYPDNFREEFKNDCIEKFADEYSEDEIFETVEEVLDNNL